MSLAKERIILIAGCSHTGGYEIDGTMDSEYNRKHSYGGLLATKYHRTPIHLAAGGVSNSYILRNVLLWFANNYDPETQDVLCLVGWTDSSRWEIPLKLGQDIQSNNPNLTWFDKSLNDYLTIQMGWTHDHPDRPEQVAMQKTYHNLIGEFPEQMEILSFNYALQLQSFFKSLGITYVMADTLYNFDLNNIWLSPQANLLDTTRYLNPGDPCESFYLKYSEKYPNVSQNYLHLGAEAHQDFAQEIDLFLSQGNQQLRA